MKRNVLIVKECLLLCSINFILAGCVVSCPVCIKNELPCTKLAGKLVSQLHAPELNSKAGLFSLNIPNQGDTLLYVPSGIQDGTMSPLVVVLHGANANEEQSLKIMREFADRYKLITLIPKSSGPSWDLILDTFGPDVESIDKALNFTFDHYAIDPTRVALAGFSDGASYALSLGVANGELFTHLMAFSPSFIVRNDLDGLHQVFISHGTSDTLFPIALSRDIYETLNNAKYSVHFKEFEGSHGAPAYVVDEALKWFLSGREEP